jgi:hypothetical protein
MMAPMTSEKKCTPSAIREKPITATITAATT